MKVCSAYGAGFYYIPGTDICLRVGGYIWSEWELQNNGNQVSDTPASLSPAHVDDRNHSDITTRTRVVYINDARTATPYGTLRAYTAVGVNFTSPGVGPASGGAANAALYPERFFIQLGGWTFGYVGSFFDFSSGFAMTTLQSFSLKWTTAWAYTAQMGNGLSATLAVEDASARRSAITTGASYAGATNALFAAGLATNFYGGLAVPDIIGNLRVDGGWGSAQISGLLHQVRANDALIGAFPAAGDTWGGAILGGIELKTPTGPGDSFLLQGVWSNGAIEATGISGNPLANQASIGYRVGGTNTGGVFNDAVGPIIDLFDSYVDAAGHHLTKAWSVNGQFRHFWDPMTRSAIFAGYTKIDAAAAANAAPTGFAATGIPDGDVLQIGANTIWSPVKDFDLGVEVVWTRISSTCQVAGGCGVVPGAATNAQNWQGKTDDILSAIVRARRNW